MDDGTAARYGLNLLLPALSPPTEVAGCRQVHRVSPALRRPLGLEAELHERDEELTALVKLPQVVDPEAELRTGHVAATAHVLLDQPDHPAEERVGIQLDGGERVSLHLDVREARRAEGPGERPRQRRVREVTVPGVENPPRARWVARVERDCAPVDVPDDDAASG